MGSKNQDRDSCFVAFNADLSGIELPKKFTFPFYYEPHALSALASHQLQEELRTQTQWNHDFGLVESDTIDSGKMFGVLVVENAMGELGFLKGFSGKLADTPRPEGFVPHVYDLLPGKNFFEVGMQKINAITAKIGVFEKHSEFSLKKQELKDLKLRSQVDLEEVTQSIAEAKKERNHLRKEQKSILETAAFEQLSSRLNQESVQKKFYLKHLTEHWEEKVAKAQQETDAFYREYEQLKASRKSGSMGLQRQIFEHYEFLNSKGQVQNLLQIFNQLGVHQPPAGAGDCAAPKLIQYAYKMGYKPICMAEFWWGQSPKSEIKIHENYYPACTGKCQPILSHMLHGLDVDANPMTTGTMAHLNIETVYEDAYLVVINKPSGLLSVPGKAIHDSVASRMKLKYPEATGPLIVHRLDMPTSGLMLIAKSLEIHDALQKQFIKRSIQKRYIAVLAGLIESDSGTIDLPLRVDLENRPHQLVCYEYGKSARTNFEVISRTENTTRIYFHPVTGRTHQLRMHAAHHLGLNTPIMGDSLYGKKNDRLYLHAEYLAFDHPISGKRQGIQVAADF